MSGKRKRARAAGSSDGSGTFAEGAKRKTVDVEDMNELDNRPIDANLYSRQLYVVGEDAMHAIAKSGVFIAGMGGLGAEIAKNIVLAGTKVVTIQDSHIARVEDLGTQCFLRAEDVEKKINR
jgi:tRNA A37 threonylcarbamoyladenosine dehydratase